MSDKDENEKPNFKVLRFDNVKSIFEERNKDEDKKNKILAEMLKKLAERADKGELDGFVMTLKTTQGSVESLIGGLSKGYDFINYVGMLESLKLRLLNIMSEFSYIYYTAQDDNDEPPTQT